jgi:hypothetical protein
MKLPLLAALLAATASVQAAPAGETSPAVSSPLGPTSAICLPDVRFRITAFPMGTMNESSAYRCAKARGATTFKGFPNNRFVSLDPLPTQPVHYMRDSLNCAKATSAFRVVERNGKKVLALGTSVVYMRWDSTLKHYFLDTAPFLSSQQGAQMAVVAMPGQLQPAPNSPQGSAPMLYIQNPDPNAPIAFTLPTGEAITMPLCIDLYDNKKGDVAVVANDCMTYPRLSMASGLGATISLAS